MRIVITLLLSPIFDIRLFDTDWLEKAESIEKSFLKISPTYPSAHAKVKKWIFDVELQRNSFKFGIISNDFLSSRIWAFQIEVKFTRFENPKNPGIQPTHFVPVSHSKKIPVLYNILKSDLNCRKWRESI